MPAESIRSGHGSAAIEFAHRLNAVIQEIGGRRPVVLPSAEPVAVIPGSKSCAERCSAILLVVRASGRAVGGRVPSYASYVFAAFWLSLLNDWPLVPVNVVGLPAAS